MRPGNRVVVAAAAVAVAEAAKSIPLPADKSAATAGGATDAATLSRHSANWSLG